MSATDPGAGLEGEALAGGLRPPLLSAIDGPPDIDATIARVLETMPTALACFDAEWRISYVNNEAVRLLGRPREELIGANHWELFPATVGDQTELSYRQAVATGQPVAFEAYYQEPLNGWFEVRAWPSEGSLAVHFLDVTERRAVLARAHEAARRLALLSEVTAELTGTLDAAEAVARLAPLVVPALADWCIVTLVEDTPAHGQDLKDVGCWHGEPEHRDAVADYVAVRLVGLSSESPLRQAMRTGQPRVVAHDAGPVVSAFLGTPEAKRAYAALDTEALAVLPLRGRGRTVGLLTLGNGSRRGAFRDDELAVADEVATRAGLALDNARLFAQQRDLADGLQRSLLTAPPEPDHMQVVVRYESAAEAAQVGGDWYDSFMQPDGTTVVVIGDVIGHDTAAAAAMGQIRALLRGIAARTGDGPADILCGVDQVIETLRVDTTASAVVARIEQSPDERERGITRLRWSNAGHPPPMVINPDGTVVVLSGIEADLLLGIDPNSARIESEISVDRGATVLLYTDGLVERRGQSLDEGLTRLRDLLIELSGLGLDELCDELLARMLP
jgi:PAS domain S-box-containing protein